MEAKTLRVHNKIILCKLMCYVFEIDRVSSSEVAVVMKLRARLSVHDVSRFGAAL